MSNEALDYLNNYISLIKGGNSDILRVANDGRFKKDDFKCALGELESTGYKIRATTLEPQHWGKPEIEGYEITWDKYIKQHKDNKGVL